MIEGTFWQEKLENIAVGPHCSLEKIAHVCLVFCSLLTTCINYLVGSSHLPGEIVKIDLVFDQRGK